MDSLDDHHYTVNRFLLTCVGLWPYERTWFTYAKRVCYLLIVVSAIMVQVLSMVITRLRIFTGSLELIQPLLAMAGVDTHYKFSIRLMTILGLWPYVNVNYRRVQIILVNTFCTYFVTVQVRSVLFFDVISVNIIFDAVTNITFTLIILLKHLLYLCNLKAVKELLEMIRADWRRINDPYEMRILLKNADDGKLTGTILAAGLHVMIMSYVVVITRMHGVSNSTASADDYMVYSRLKLMYTKNDEKYYLVSLMHTYIVVLIGLMALGGTEATMVLCGHHGSGILQILRHRIRKVFDDDEMDVITPKKDRATIGKIIDVAIVHMRILRYKQLVSDSILTGYFFLLVLMMASMTLNLLRFSYAMLRFRKLSQTFPIAAVIVGHFMYIGLMNHLGQTIINNGAGFFSDTYAGRWYRATVPAQKLLLFIMCHSKKDLVFVLGGIFRPSYEGFTAMTKLAVSYLMVMYSLEI